MTTSYMDGYCAGWIDAVKRIERDETMKPSPIRFETPRGSNKTPTERTLDFLKSLHYPAGIVERRIRKDLSMDLFHIIDIIALTPHGILGVQSTGQDFAGHRTKLTETRALESARWLRTPGASLMLIGWRRIKKERGKKKVVWAPRIEMIAPRHLSPELEKRGRLDLLEPIIRNSDESALEANFANAEARYAE